METNSLARCAFLVLCLLAMPMLIGCNTTAGFGRDVQASGRWIEGGAQDTQAWMFGSPAQAAETGSPEQEATPAAGGNVVYFESGSAEIPPDGRELIRAMAADFSQGTNRIAVAGHADTAGPADYNEQLSQRRAEAVAAELSAHGIERSRISVEWHGEEQLPVPTGDGVSEPQNRRASIGIASG